MGAQEGFGPCWIVFDCEHVAGDSQFFVGHDALLAGESEPLTVVPLVLPRSRTIQMPFKNLSVQCLPEMFSKSRRISLPARRPMTISGFVSGMGSPPPTGARPQVFRKGDAWHFPREFDLRLDIISRPAPAQTRRILPDPSRGLKVRPAARRICAES